MGVWDASSVVVEVVAGVGDAGGIVWGCGMRSGTSSDGGDLFRGVGDAGITWGCGTCHLMVVDVFRGVGDAGIAWVSGVFIV